MARGPRFPTFGEALVAARKRAGYLTQASFSDAISDAWDRKVRQGVVSRWESGSLPTLDTLKQLGHFLGVPWEALVIGPNGVTKVVKWDRDGRPIVPRPPVEEKKQPEQPRAAGDLRSARRAAGGGRS